MEYFSATKKNEKIPCEATWMDLEITILSEISQKEKDKSHEITYMWYLKYDTNELFYEAETDSQTYRTDLWLQGGCWGRDALGVWD